MTKSVEGLASFVAGGGAVESSVFREMVEILPVAIYTTDAEGRLTYFNAEAVKLSGRVPELGTDQWCVTWKIFLPDGTPLPHDQCPMAVALKGGEVPNGIECIAERPDRTRFWFSPCPAVLRNAEGQIVGGINLLFDITDRKNAEIEATENFRAIVAATPECVTIVASDGNLLFMNAPGLVMLGARSPEEIIGKSVYELIAPEYRETFRDFHRRVCLGEEGVLEFDSVGLRGERRRMETHAAPLRHTDGTIVHLAVSHDITERKQAEHDALLLGAIVDSSDDAIISKNLDSTITSWNKSAERLFGYTASETIGQPVTILIPPDRLDEEPQILDRLKRGERVDHFETVRQTKDGRLIDISLTISPVKDGRGNIIGASKIARDVSERRRMEEALRASQASFRQLADSMPHMVWTARPDGYLDYYNERWYEFTGFGREDSSENLWERIVHPDDLQRVGEAWGEALKSGNPYTIECRLWDQTEKRWRWFLGRALPIRDAEGNVAKWFGSSTDIDDQKRTEDDLRRANADLEQFAFSATHDLQEPLRAIKIYSELLTKTCGPAIQGEGQQFLGHLRGGASRMEMLVRDLLSYTKVSQFERPEDYADAGEALNSALANLSSAIQEVEAEITSDPLPSVRLHEAHVQQLFQNLIGNAIKYRSPDMRPRVHVSVDRQGNEWVFAISDNGIGIAPDYSETVFGLFKRLHTNDEYSGTGIGLAICRRIVERSNGRIWVESEAGKGSTFRFSIPI